MGKRNPPPQNNGFHNDSRANEIMDLLLDRVLQVLKEGRTVNTSKGDTTVVDPTASDLGIAARILIALGVLSDTGSESEMQALLRSARSEKRERD
ncbi:MAG: hypothetical protein D6692_09325 [Planctomycetota bacterium]|nr:MAG: hypothetical protein D6692_09325 [Planctomycetota bacterium]